MNLNLYKVMLCRVALIFVHEILLRLREAREPLQN